MATSQSIASKAPTTSVPYSEDSESSSELSSSSDNSDSADEDNSSQPEEEQAGAEDVPLRDRLRAFLPQLQQANAQLNQSSDRRTEGFELRGEDSEEDEGYSSESEDRPYIEMDLGLGVLEQMAAGKSDGNVAIPSSQDGASKQSRKRSVDVTDSEGGEKNALANLTATERAGNVQESGEKKPKRSKIEVIESANDAP